MEQEWFENIRNGLTPLCDWCLDYKKKQTPLIKDDFFNRRNQRGVYCEKCWNWIHLQHYTDDKGNKYTLRSERNITSWPK